MGLLGLDILKSGKSWAICSPDYLLPSTKDFFFFTGAIIASRAATEPSSSQARLINARLGS